MNKPAVTRAKMERAARALTNLGLPVAGFRLRLDGSVDVLTGPANDPSPADPLDDELAQWAAKHGYDQP